MRLREMLRLTAFMTLIILRGRILLLMVVGMMLVASDVDISHLPLSFVGFIAGSYAAALAALATSLLIASSGQFSEYCMARIGCMGFTISSGLASAVSASIVSLAGLASETTYVLLSKSSYGFGFSTNIIYSSIYTAILMSYGYILVALLVRSSLPLLVFLIIVTRIVQYTHWLRDLYIVPLATALTGILMQIVICNSPRLIANLTERGRLRWKKLAKLRRSYSFYLRPRSVGEITYRL